MSESLSTFRNSILPPDMQGVMFITGFRGSGKSYLAAQADIPANVAYIDLEEKGASIHSQLNFGLYRPLTREVADIYGADAGPGHLFPALTDTFLTLDKDRFTVVVIDNIKPLEDASLFAAKATPAKYGVDARNARSGRFGGAWPGVHYIVSNLCDILHSRGVQLIIVTSHIKRRWGGGGPIPGKWDVKGVDRWQELSILTLILTQRENAPVPTALVQKEQLGLIQYDEAIQDFIIRRRLPLRIPYCTFGEIRRYLREPADLADPNPDEVPSAEEMAPFDEKLSREQLAYLIAGMDDEAAIDEALDRNIGEKVEKVTTASVSSVSVHPSTWQRLLEMTGKTLGDLGGIRVARRLSEGEIVEKWEAWK